MSNRINLAHARSQLTLRRAGIVPSEGTASAYDHAGDDYLRYADGEDLDDAPAPVARSAQADTIVWQTICSAIEALQRDGASTLRILDAGCGPGTWLRRIAVHAHRQGLRVDAVGFDISTGQLDIARRRAETLSAHIGDGEAPKLEFVRHDLVDPLPWQTGQFHVVLCNFAVLNHLARAALPTAIAELCRVASQRVIATLRALASPPTACIVGTDQVRQLHEDCARGRLHLLSKDGTRHVLTFNLYGADALKALFAPHAAIADLRAIDLFVSRFAPDANWTKTLVEGLAGRQQVMQRLKELEEPLCRLPGWVDHGTHVLIVARPLHNDGRP
jgi:SAM-dependent methyltransferase